MDKTQKKIAEILGVQWEKASVIVFVIQNQFGFGSKMVYERIKMLMDYPARKMVKAIKKV